MGKDPDRGERGSSGFPAGFDTILWIEKCNKDEDGVHTLQLLVRKQKDSEDGQRYWFQSKKVATPDGDSLVLVAVDEETGRAGISQPKTHTALSGEDIRAALRILIPHGGTTTRKELMEQLEKLTRKSQKTINNSLSAGSKEGGPFYCYTRPNGEWGLPLKDHLPISLRDTLRDDDAPNPEGEPKPQTAVNSIFV